jgi:hypothetical protein
MCAAIGSAQTISDADLFCKIELFTRGKGKPVTPEFRACESLKDPSDVKIKSYEECKHRALEKAEACLKRLKKADQVAVTGHFTQKLSVSQDSTKFTCELGTDGVSACP